jgi:exodeoxyribonuclease V gamma subunit
MLVEALGEVLAEPLADPIQTEIVAVPTRGVERWLTQRLAHRLGASPDRDGGVCANLSFPFPGVLISEVTSGPAGGERVADPWRPERAVWPLIEVIDHHLDQPWLSTLAGHLRATTPPSLKGEAGSPRRFAAARKLADLFDTYAIHRPDTVLAWLATEPEDWQGRLWRCLRDRIGVESPAERLTAAAARIAAGASQLSLPSRVSVFGLTRLPVSYVEVLQAVAQARDVHLYLLHPSSALWERVARQAPLPRHQSRSADRSGDLVANPLLRSWGRDAREMQLVLAARGVTRSRHYPLPEPEPAGPSLLQRLQAGIRADRAVPDTDRDRALLDPSDSSLRVHACHGRARQVQVLRDAILHLLQDDPTLEPRDVIVMCPDIESFAPLVQAAFASGDQDDPPLRVRLADRALRQTNPLLGVAARLLALAGSRVSGPEVVDLAACVPVSRRFGFDPSDLSMIEEWVAETGIRWGVDARHRQPWALDGLASNTWAAGLDRLLLGVAMSEDGCRLFESTLPYGDLPSSAVDLAGRVAEFVQRLAGAIDGLARTQPVSSWVNALISGTEMLATVPAGDAWQHEQFLRTLAEVSEESAGAASLLTRDEAEALLSSRLEGRPTRANFRTGDLTICTLVPMRSVPHRVVALLGLDDGAFPRHPESDGDDLLLDDPRIGERDGRSEDRQLLLDAVLAATERLIITYSGRDERTNRRLPPCVPVAELLDVIDATVSGITGPRARDEVVVDHPLQPFDAHNFTSGALASTGPWSFDPVYLRGAEASTRQQPVAPWLDEPLPPPDERVVQLDHLVQFVEHPVRAFLRRRLGLYLSDAGEDLNDSIPIELDPLERWAVGDRLLSARLAGVPAVSAEAAERSRGALPPGVLADRVFADIRGGVEELLRVVESLGFVSSPADSLDVHLDLPDGRTIVGTVPDVRGSTLVRCVYSRLAAKHRIAAWVRFLALSAARADLAVSSIMVGRGQSKQPPAISLLAPLSGQEAAHHLVDLLDLYDCGMCEPLPIPCATAAAWAECRHAGGTAEDAFVVAGRAWSGSNIVPGEDADVNHVHIWGRHLSLLALMADTRGPSDPSPGWPTREKSRFGQLALRLWAPMLAHETLTRVK